MTAPRAETYHCLTFENIEEGAAFVAALSRFVASPASSTAHSPTGPAAAVEVAAAWPPGSQRLEVYLSAAALDATIRGFGAPDIVATCSAAHLPPARILLLGHHDHGAYGRDEMMHRMKCAGLDERA